MEVSDMLSRIGKSTPLHIHVIGIGGSGMSAIATVLAAMGHIVSGSDAADSESLRQLGKKGIVTFVGHRAEQISTDLDFVCRSTAVNDSNPEVLAAGVLDVPVFSRSETLSAIARSQHSIAVAGTHGKTTTSTLTAAVLMEGGLDPSFIIGGQILGHGNGARWSDSDYFVIEADESDGTFLNLGAPEVIITNVEPDHLEYYGGWRQLQAAFEDFANSATGHRVLCIDDEGAAALAEKLECVTYGTAEAADYRIADVVSGRFEADFTIVHDGESTAVHLPAPGLHNVRNATAAIAMGNQLGIPLAIGAVGVGKYSGVGRRFQFRGEKNGINFVDDYAHLPSEVAAAISAAREGDWKRVVAVFQPHRYSRTEQVGRDFVTSFAGVDVLVLTDVYAAGEPARPGIDGLLVKNAVDVAGVGELIYEEKRNSLPVVLASILEPGDLCLTLGAGDVTNLADEIQLLL